MNGGDNISKVQSCFASKHAILPSSLLCLWEKAKPEDVSGVLTAAKTPVFFTHKSCPCSGEGHHGPASTMSNQNTAEAVHQYKDHLENSSGATSWEA